MSKNDQMGRHPQGEDVNRPMTGAEYLESLRDQREVWIYGERVKDVTLHPAFRNQARMVARMYDESEANRFLEVAAGFMSTYFPNTDSSFSEFREGDAIQAELDPKMHDHIVFTAEKAAAKSKGKKAETAG